MLVQSSSPLVPVSAAPGYKDSPVLRVGERLDVVVESRLAGSGVLLRVLSSGQMLAAQSDVPLHAGTRLQVEVVAPASLDAVIRLKIMPDALPTQTEAEVRADAVRQFLPRQEPIATLTRMLAEGPGAWPKQNLPLLGAIREFMAVIPQRANLVQPERLQQAMLDSGVFLEARLMAQEAGGLGRDVKARLFRLKAAVTDLIQSADSPVHTASRTGLEALARNVDGALAHIVMDQLASLPDSADTRQVLQLSLPVQEGQHQDAVELVLTRESAVSARQAEEEWSVELTLNPPGLGTVQGRLVWRQGRLETWLWSDVAATTAHIAAHTEVLEARYRQAGLEPGRVTALPGGLKRPSRSTRAVTDTLVDIKV